MNNTLSQNFIILHEFTLFDPYKWDASGLHVSGVAFVSTFCTRLVMPVIPVKLHNQIKGRDISIYDKLPYTILAYIIKAHSNQKLTADNFKCCRFSAFISAITATVFRALIEVGGFNAVTLPTVCTNDGDTNTGAILTNTGTGTKVAHSSSYKMWGFVCLLATIQAWNHLSIFLQRRKLFCNVQSCTPHRTIVAFPWLYQRVHLPKFSSAVIAIYKFTRPLWIIDTPPGSIVTRLTAKQTRFVIGVLFKLLSAGRILANKYLLDGRLTGAHGLIAHATTVFRNWQRWIDVSLKRFFTVFANQCFLHASIITDEVAF